MKLALSILILIPLLSGCVARLDKLPGSVEKLKHAPINTKDQYGIVSYDIEDGEDGARQDAYDEMYKACHGKYKIIKEELRDGNDAFTMKLDKNAAILDSETRLYIKFMCVE